MDARPVGLGCMRLSTEASRDDARATAVLAAALDAGINLLDTSDAYALHADDAGHNERLIAAAIAQSRRPIQVVTKGGLTRPGGAWVPNGRARHLATSARASRDRLAVPSIDLYLLHAVDPRTDLATSVRALARLREDGVARAIGLSNVGLPQLELALTLAPIEAVEVELNPWQLDALHSGLITACAQRGIRVLAHRPLGGPAGARRAARHPVLASIAARHHATPAEVVLAWLRSLSPVIVPLPGATRPATATAAARAARLELDEPARAALAAAFLPYAGTTSVSVSVSVSVSASARSVSASARSASAELVMLVGMQASGKSTLAASYAERGYIRLNRDELGGTLRGLALQLDRLLAGGADHVIVDNTYGTRAQRAPVLEIARRHGLVVRCLEMATPLEVAQANAVERILDRHGRLLNPFELRTAARRDPNMFAPGVQFRFRREYEPPRADEGFDSIESVSASRATRGTRRALLLELDDLVWTGRPDRPEAIRLVDRERCRAALAPWASHPIAGTTWQPGLAPAALPALAAQLASETGVAISLLCCPHPPGPPICWCRKPLPGLALAFARAHDVDLSRSVCLGRSAADRGFATRAGMPYADLTDGWPLP